LNPDPGKQVTIFFDIEGSKTLRFEDKIEKMD